MRTSTGLLPFVLVLVAPLAACMGAGDRIGETEADATALSEQMPVPAEETAPEPPDEATPPEPPIPPEETPPDVGPPDPRAAPPLGQAPPEGAPPDSPPPPTVGR